MNAETVGSMAERYLAVETAHVADALEKLGIRTPELPTDLVPVGRHARFAGPAATLRLALSRTGRESRGINVLIEDTAAPGDVLCIDAQGCRDSVLFGDRAALGALEHGCVGAVVNGIVRDVEGIDDLGFPVHAVGAGLRASEGRFMAVGIDVDLVIGGVLVQPEDWLVGGRSGICVIPRDLVEQVLTLAEERDQVDKETLGEIRSGATLRSAHRHFRDDDHEEMRRLE